MNNLLYLKPLTVALACVSAFAVPRTSAAQHHGANQIVLVAKVEAIIPLSAFSGKITLVDFDPSFALTLRVAAMLPVVNELSTADTVTFGVHAPTRLFAGEPENGRMYTFLLRHAITNGRSTFTGLTVRMTSVNLSTLTDMARRVIGTAAITGWDDKAFNRAGDTGSVAILHVLPNGKITTSPTRIRSVLVLIRESFSCLDRCVEAPDDKEPSVTMLLLEHLREHGLPETRSEIDRVQRFVTKEVESAKASR